jgi:hypothetical protein
MRFDLEWQSSADERYTTNMNQRAAALVQPPHVLIAVEGGSDGEVADNNLIVESPSVVEAQRLAYAVQKEVGYYVRVTELHLEQDPD